MNENKKVAQRLARPVSLIITLIVVVSVIGLVVFGVLPKLGGHFYINRERDTVIYAESAELGRRDFSITIRKIKEWLDSLTLDWDK